MHFQNVRHLFVPAERKIPRVRIETRQSENLSKQRIIVAIDSWPRNSRYPLGHFVRALGNVGDKETENEVLLLEHDVPHSRFSDAVLSFLPKLPWLITEAVRKRNPFTLYLYRSLDSYCLFSTVCNSISRSAFPAISRSVFPVR